MRRFLVALGILAALALAVTTLWIAPYALKARRIPADPDAGFHAGYFLYVSGGARRRAENGLPAVLLVQPNNSGTNSDDASVHSRDAWWTGFERRGTADELGVVLLVPAFLRPAVDWKIYTHALDRDTLTTSREDLARLDLQLLAMIDDARVRLQSDGIETEPRVLIQGFSASGMFANRFTALHPERVLAAAVGAPGGWPIAPLEQSGADALTYPVGIADLQALTDRPFDAAAFAAVPQLFVLGALDDNDSLDFGDGYEPEQAQLVDRLFGADPQSRWDDAQAAYAAVGARAEFLRVDGVGHDRKALQGHSTAFFARILDE